VSRLDGSKKRWYGETLMISRDESTVLALAVGGLVLVMLMLAGAGGFIYFFLYESQAEFNSAPAAPMVVVSEKAASIEDAPPKIGSEPPIPDTYAVIVHAAADGSIKQIEVNTPEEKTTLVSLAAFCNYLRRLRPELPAAPRFLIQAERGLDAARIEEVKNAFQQAGLPRPDRVTLLEPAVEKP
jgi:hypothetical protein